MICNAGDVVLVPFPFVDSPRTKKRPALVLSRKKFNQTDRHSVLAMITTGGGFSWKSDSKISDLQTTGLSAPSVVRMKLFTLDNRVILRQIGYLDTRDRKRILNTMKHVVGLE